MVTTIDTGSTTQTQKGIGEMRILVPTVHEEDAPLYQDEIIGFRYAEGDECGLASTMRRVGIEVPKERAPYIKSLLSV